MDVSAELTNQTQYNTQAGIAFGGYTCSQCGTWITNGGFHQCWQAPYTPSYTTPAFTTPTFTASDHTIVAELKAIRELLQKLYDGII